jgi:putative transposase
VGYGAFSIGQSQVAAVSRYIDRQEEHHRVYSFQEELRDLLKRYQVAYDERYVWDCTHGSLVNVPALSPNGAASP